MRLAAQAKMGYYPTPKNVTSIISKFIKRQHKGLIRILDPCTGEGIALKFIGDHLGAETYGIEIDLERGNRAKDILNKCLITDYQNTRISHGSFSLLWLNPPYDWSEKNTEFEKSERYERTFLRDCIPYLCSEGILIYLIPHQRLDTHIAKILSYRFEKISVFRFPEEEYKAFKQLVILGVLKKKAESDEKTAQYLRRCGQSKEALQFLPEDPAYTYEVPLSPKEAKFIFRSMEINPDELAIEIQQYGLFQEIREITTPLRIAEKIRPIMPLRHGHLAQILACGLMNGVVWDKEKKNPLLVKGMTKKETKYSVEIQGDIEKHIETDQIKIVIHAFNKRGEMLTIQ
ncbi:MAG: class I SAM-dependent methyltransferase [Deltaproteobacteria bacterium]|nr:class I SAM-dependent methyltransferase [Deltaproteobacteria bacterium]MBW2045294.1 class I SAM-dependent methyltransferase [Deltaproteobacteria bacterium]